MVNKDDLGILLMNMKKAAKIHFTDQKMPPNPLRNSSYYLTETNSAEPVQIVSKPSVQYQPPVAYKKPVKGALPKYRWEIVWRNVIIFLYLHLGAVYGLFLILSGVAMFKTYLFAIIAAVVISQGVTSGAHRLWAHRTYKAKLPLRIFLAICQTAALQNHIYEWVRDHRVHHKFTDTDADPHNAERGFFFSHVGWLLVKKHKDVMVKGKTVDMSDVAADPVVQFQRKFYVLLAPVLCLGVPTFIPCYFWNESLIVSFYVAGVLRYILSLNGTWLVNSAAHIWGYKPYDKTIGPTENISVAVIAFGEGWHNYHHVFPWDYKAAELGNYRLNLSTAFIDLMAYIGQAYELKTVSVDMIKKRVRRTGDGTRVFEDSADDDHVPHHEHDGIWGWGDKDMQELDIKLVQIHNKKEN